MISVFRHRRSVVIAAAVSAGFCPLSRGEVSFNLIPAAGMNPQAIAGFQAAAQRWSSLFSDNLTVNLNIDFRPLGSGILGQASSSDALFSYSTVRTALGNDRISADDFTSHSFLQTGSSVDLLINYTRNSPHGRGDPMPYLDDDGDANNSNIRLDHANAKALGLRSANDPASDASIAFSSSFTWDFDPRNGITGGAFDFVGVATHEIGHALGFGSGVDILDINSQGQFFRDHEFIYVSAADLFRFSTVSIANGVGVIDWTAGTGAKYFSINGGTTNLAGFATGTTHGDGNQASHWKDSLFIGIMDPTSSPGELLQITLRDWQLLDVIGWNQNHTWRWIDPAGGSFQSSPRWSSDMVPGAAQTAVFDQNATYNVTFSADASNAAVSVRGGNVTLALGTRTYNASGAVKVAEQTGDNAALAISNGELNSATAEIAPAAGSSGAVTINGAAWNSGSVYVGGSASGAGGAGSLTLNSGSVDVANTLKAFSGGTIHYNGGTLTATTVELSGGAMLVLSSGGDKVLQAGNVVVTGGSTIDLGDNAAVFSAETLAHVQDLIIEGFNNGDWLGGGITSSSAANDTSFVTALGVADNAELALASFAGVTGLSGAEILVKYTWYGDADLGGTVNLDDFNQFLFGYNNGLGGPPAIWLNGDFDYNQSINLDDFNQFLFGLQNQGAALVSPELFAALSEFARDEQMDVDLSAVPEPGGVLLVVMAGTGFLRRGSRQRARKKPAEYTGRLLRPALR